MFGKHFASMYTGSMFGAGPDVFAVWGYVISNTRRDATVELNPAVLAASIGTTQERMSKALEYLTQPDPRSRSKKEGGRRLVQQGEFLYLVVNHADYRAIRHEDDRREYLRLKKRESRARRKGGVNTPVNRGQPRSTHAEAEAEAEAETSTEGAGGGGDRPDLTLKPPRKPSSRRPSRQTTDASAPAGAARFVEAFNLAFGRRVSVLPGLVTDFAARKADGYSTDQLVVLPILAAAAELPDDLRRDMKPAWLLRNGSHPRAGADGRVSGGKNWVVDLLSGADRATLWPRHVAAAEAVGVLEELRRLGARFAEAE
jgi:hypothetical protein